MVLSGSTNTDSSVHVVFVARGINAPESICEALAVELWALFSNKTEYCGNKTITDRVKDRFGSEVVPAANNIALHNGCQTCIVGLPTTRILPELLHIIQV